MGRIQIAKLIQEGGESNSLEPLLIQERITFPFRELVYKPRSVELSNKTIITGNPSIDDNGILTNSSTSNYLTVDATELKNDITNNVLNAVQAEITVTIPSSLSQSTETLLGCESLMFVEFNSNGQLKVWNWLNSGIEYITPDTSIFGNTIKVTYNRLSSGAKSVYVQLNDTIIGSLTSTDKPFNTIDLSSISNIGIGCRGDQEYQPGPDLAIDLINSKIIYGIPYDNSTEYFDYWVNTFGSVENYYDSNI